MGMNIIKIGIPQWKLMFTYPLFLFGERVCWDWGLWMVVRVGKGAVYKFSVNDYISRELSMVRIVI